MHKITPRINTGKSYNDWILLNMAVATQRTRHVFKWPYSSCRMTDLGFWSLMESLEASWEKQAMASHPHVSVTRGTQNQPRSPHLSSLAECFLTSPVWAVAPAQTPASDKVSVLSGEVTQMSKAAGLPLDQFWTRTLAGLVWLWSGVRLFPASTLTLRWANLHDSATTSQSLLWRNTASPPRLQVEAWWPNGSSTVSGHKEHSDPSDVSRPSHHLMATWNWSGFKWRPRPSEGTTDNHDEAWGDEMDKRRGPCLPRKMSWRAG